MKANDFFRGVDFDSLGKNFNYAVELVNKSLSVMPQEEKTKYVNLISKANQVNRELKEKGFDPTHLSGLEKLNDELTKECKDLGAN